MFNHLLTTYRHQFLLWKLHGLEGWRDELYWSAKKVREAQARNVEQIDRTKTLLAKLDGEAMLNGEARVVVK